MRVFDKTKKLIQTGRNILSPGVKSSGNPFYSQAFGDFSTQNDEFNTTQEQVAAYGKIPWVAIATDKLMEKGQRS